jgi:nitrite reductase/ring-hydroxylating ferredoxin subunit
MRTAVLIAQDRSLGARLARLGDEFDLVWVTDQTADPVDLVVIDLADAGAVDKVGRARRRWPTAVIAGYLAVPNPDMWIAGQRAGCDIVANRGAIGGRLRAVLADAGRRSRTFPLLDEVDVAGRLGLVARIAETPVGAVALYQVDGSLHAVADRCPHAGAVLSEGELEQRVVTCPRHGSQFDVCTGERLRGPADTSIATYPVVVAGGQVSFLL